MLGAKDQTVSAAGVIAPDGRSGMIRSIGVNTFYQIASQLVPAVAAIAAIPFLLRQLGYDVFGVVTIFSTALAYFAMLDLGLGRAATRFISQSLEADKPDEVRRYFWGSIILLSVTGAIVMAGSLLSVPSAVGFLKLSKPYLRPAKESFYIICLTIPVVTLTATLRGFLEASGRFRFIGIVTGCGGVATYVLPLFAVTMGGGLVAIAVVFAGIRVTVCAILALGCLSIARRPSLRPIFDTTAVRRMLSFGGWLSVSNIIGTATIYCDRFLLGMWVGMAAVTSYGIPLDLISRMQLLITSFCTVLFPLMSRLNGSRSGQFQTLYRGAVAVGLSLMTPIAATAVMVAPALMKLWLGQRVTSDAIFAAQVFLAGGVAQSIASITWTALHARGRSDLTAWVHLVEFPLYCGAFYLAATHFGARGAALAWLGRGIADFLCMVLLLQTHGAGLGFSTPPELVAAIATLGILSVAILPLPEAVIVAVLVSVLTWVWSWRTLLNPTMRIQLARLLLGRRTAKPAC